MSDERAAELLTARLRRLFPEAGKDLLPEKPSAFMMTRHGSDPLMQGAYTTVKAGVPLEETLQSIIAPLAARAVSSLRSQSSDGFVGYLHGAYESGLRAAGEALKEMGKEAILKSACGGSSARDL